MPHSLRKLPGCAADDYRTGPDSVCCPLPGPGRPCDRLIVARVRSDRLWPRGADRCSTVDRPSPVALEVGSYLPDVDFMLFQQHTVAWPARLLLSGAHVPVARAFSAFCCCESSTKNSSGGFGHCSTYHVRQRRRPAGCPGHGSPAPPVRRYPDGWPPYCTSSVPALASHFTRAFLGRSRVCVSAVGGWGARKRLLQARQQRPARSVWRCRADSSDRCRMARGNLLYITAGTNGGVGLAMPVGYGKHLALQHPCRLALPRPFHWHYLHFGRSASLVTCGLLPSAIPNAAYRRWKRLEVLGDAGWWWHCR